jgi:heat shock protein HslJ
MRCLNWVAAAAVLALLAVPSAVAAQEFPFGSELTLDAAPMRGSKRIPVIEIGNSGEVQLDLYCKRAQGQFSVAGDTVIFIAGAVGDANCPPDRARADDALLAALSAATNWRRQGDYLTLVGPRSLRFHLNTN